VRYSNVSPLLHEDGLYNLSVAVERLRLRLSVSSAGLIGHLAMLRGATAIRPGQTWLQRLAIVPALFTVRGIMVNRPPLRRFVDGEERAARWHVCGSNPWLAAAAPCGTDLDETTGRLWRSAD
jgi:hypothetical protein